MGDLMNLLAVLLLAFVFNSEAAIESLNAKELSDIETYVFSDDGELNKKWKMVYQVAISKSPVESVKFLNKCVDSKVWYLQSAAFKSFNKLYPNKGLVRAREELLISPSLIVRAEAVEYIKKNGNETDIKRLFAALKSPKNFRGRYSLWIRPALAKAIDHLDKKSSFSTEWKKLTNDSDKLVRKMARSQSKKF